MVSLITRESGGPARSGLVPLGTIAVITALRSLLLHPGAKGAADLGGTPPSGRPALSFDDCHTASGVVQCPQQTVVKCQLENLRIRSRGGAF